MREKVFDLSAKHLSRRREVCLLKYSNIKLMVLYLCCRGSSSGGCQPPRILIFGQASKTPAPKGALRKRLIVWDTSQPKSLPKNFVLDPIMIAWWVVIGYPL
ncbi:MAG: hypothetical protein HC773_08380 [Scytonema sp. CRU_2_7]|nr:hypothetical protein [Scytonema sp. CRU_2_7]